MYEDHRRHVSSSESVRVCVSCLALGRVSLTRMLFDWRFGRDAARQRVAVPLCGDCLADIANVHLDILLCARCLIFSAVSPARFLFYCSCNPSASLVTPLCGEHAAESLLYNAPLGTHRLVPLAVSGWRSGAPAADFSQFLVSYG